MYECTSYNSGKTSQVYNSHNLLIIFTQVCISLAIWCSAQCVHWAVRCLGIQNAAVYNTEQYIIAHYYIRLNLDASVSNTEQQYDSSVYDTELSQYQLFSEPSSKTNQRWVRSWNDMQTTNLERPKIAPWVKIFMWNYHFSALLLSHPGST